MDLSGFQLVGGYQKVSPDTVPETVRQKIWETLNQHHIRWHKITSDNVDAQMQIVNGTNYMIKFTIDPSQSRYMIKLYQPLGQDSKVVVDEFVNLSKNT